MSNFNQSGFVPLRKAGGGTSVIKTFEVTAAADDAYFPGDVVTLKATGKVRLLRNGDASTVRPLGVIVAAEKSVDGRPFPLTFSQPTNGPFLTTGQAGFVQVVVDPHATFGVEFGGNFTPAVIGAGAKVTAGTPNTQSGLSGQRLSGTVSTSADAQFQIVGLHPQELTETRSSVAAPALVEVIMVDPSLGNPI